VREDSDLEVASPSYQTQLILCVPTHFRPGGLQFRCSISSLITARQFSLDQAYFILLGQWHPAIGVLGHAMPRLALRHHVIQLGAALLQLGRRPLAVKRIWRRGNVRPSRISRIRIAGGNHRRLRSGFGATKEHSGEYADTKNCHHLFHSLSVKF